jgi:hypothetical protein
MPDLNQPVGDFDCCAEPVSSVQLAELYCDSVLAKHDVLAAQADLNRINHRNRTAYRYLLWRDLDVFEQLFDAA